MTFSRSIVILYAKLPAEIQGVINEFFPTKFSNGISECNGCSEEVSAFYAHGTSTGERLFCDLIIETSVLRASCLRSRLIYMLSYEHISNIIEMEQKALFQLLESSGVLDKYFPQDVYSRFFFFTVDDPTSIVFEEGSWKDQTCHLSYNRPRRGRARRAA